MNVLKIIEENSLTVRCLPHTVTSLLGYKKGDEERIKMPSYDTQGNELNKRKTVIYSERFKRKMIRQERDVEKGGWWCVEETAHTNSMVRFDKSICAPTLEDAIQLYLDSKD